MKYRILRPSDLIQYGDERWDFELGWTTMEDNHVERFSKEYRRAGDQAWRFRRPLNQQSIRPRAEKASVDYEHNV